MTTSLWNPKWLFHDSGFGTDLATTLLFLKIIYLYDVLDEFKHRNSVHNCALAPGGCFTNVSRALQSILSKFVCCRNHTSYEHFMLKLCSCAQSHALCTRTKFQLQILTINVITGSAYFREIILESSRNVSETTPRTYLKWVGYLGWLRGELNPYIIIILQ